MNILSIDPGRAVGWFRSDGSCGTFSTAQYEDRGEAVHRFSEWLTRQFKATATDMLLVERPFFREGTKGADFVHGLIWTAHATAYAFSVARHEETADYVRKHLIGRCRRLKGRETVGEFDQVIRSACEDRGYRPTSDHSTDACALLIAYVEKTAGLATP